MKILTILDASAIVHTGDASGWSKNTGVNGYSCNGLLSLNRQLVIGLKQGEVVIAFDSPSFRNDLAGDYKSGRVMNASVISQLNFAFNMLNDAGLNCAKFEGYEADDIIDWAAKLSPGYDLVNIVGNDYDLCHSIDDNITFQACNSLVNDVHTYDFCKALNKYTGLTFNTLSAYKVFNGCNSDNIPAYKTIAGVRGAELYGDFKKYVEEENNGQYNAVRFTQRPELLLLFAQASPKITEEDYPELIRRVKLVYPADKPEDITIKPIGLQQTRRAPLEKYFTLLNDQYALNYLNLKSVSLKPADYELMKNMKKSITSGTFAVDHDIPTDSSTSEAFELNIFSREF